MSKKDDRGRGQLHSRSQRTWRDETNPSGSTEPTDPDAATDSGLDLGRGGEDDAPGEKGRHVQTTSTDGPGGGGATESPDRAKHHEGLHGGPSRKR
ncbi:MAG: hypothetical protein M3067_02875 [Chloroflexota bacterium]|nr:hypothetical protein [Chloroflexota bacterium]